MNQKDLVSKELAQKVVDKMYSSDAFSQWLGINIISVLPGQVKISMRVRAEMLNGFGVSHGGIVFSLADSALAFASNSYGRVSLAIENSISYPVAIRQDDELIAVATELSLRERLAIYDVIVTRKDGVKVAFFKGTVYRTKDNFFPE